MALALTLLSLVLHLTSPSTMRNSEEEWARLVSYHQTKPSFAVRPLTSTAVQFLHDSAGWSYRSSFFALQFGLLLLCGPALIVWLKKLGFALSERLIGMVLFYLSLPVLLAHFEPVHTWDDFWVYLFVPLGFTVAIEGRTFLSGACLAVAILARETSLIFLIPWVVLLYQRSRPRLWPPVLGALAVAGVTALARTIWTDAGIGPGDWEWEERVNLLAFNFESFLRSRDTVFSLSAGLGILWPAGMYQLMQPPTPKSPAHYNAIRIGAVITVLGFTIPTLLFMQARETRLFFPPFVFLIPLTLLFLRRHRAALVALWRGRPVWIRVVGPLALWVIGIGFTLAAFPDFEYRKWRDGNWAVLGLHAGAAIQFGWVLWRSRGQGGDATGDSPICGDTDESYSTPQSGRTGSP